MPPRRIRAPPQQSAAAKVFKIFLLLALALGFKMLVAAGIRAYNLHPGQQQAQDLAAAGQAAGISASSGDAAEPVLTGEKSAAAGSDSSAAAQDDGAIANEYLGTETPAQVCTTAAASPPLIRPPLTCLAFLAPQMVDRLIRANRVMVFSKSYCPYSKRGKAAMRHHLGDEIGVLELDQLEGRADMAELQDELQRLTVRGVAEMGPALCFLRSCSRSRLPRPTLLC